MDRVGRRNHTELSVHRDGRVWSGERAMAGKANKAFIESGPAFLRSNVVLSPKVQAYLVGKGMDEDRLPGVYDFDLRRDTTVDYRDADGKPLKAYQLYLLEQRKMHQKGTVGPSTHPIRAFYLPWDNGRGWTMALDNRANYLFTPTLDGCSIVANRSANPRVSHINFQNPAGNRVDPDRIDAYIEEIYGADSKGGLRTLEKNDYSDDALKEAGTQFTVTVIGFRDRTDDTWDLYYQVQTSCLVDNPDGPGTLVQHRVRDALLEIG